MAQANPRHGRIGHGRHRSAVAPESPERQISPIASLTVPARAAARYLTAH